MFLFYLVWIAFVVFAFGISQTVIAKSNSLAVERGVKEKRMDCKNEPGSGTPSFSGGVESLVVLVANDNEAALDESINSPANGSTLPTRSTLEPTVADPIFLLLPAVRLADDGA